MSDHLILLSTTDAEKQAILEIVHHSNTGDRRRARRLELPIPDDYDDLANRIAQEYLDALPDPA